ncbi:TonB-dependent receptor [Duganella callida]|uniref:TonB-dependent receptor n=2 Tax=Duganella callida TaxID=2561932 RepID=A0A4Y9SXJ9_9BURK|nr:TonB-dependent receptor [Duganella callida]
MTRSDIPAQRKVACCAVSAAVMMMSAPLAQAQTQAADAQSAAADVEPLHKVQVVGTRASQQSSIERKKNAATAVDSIVAEDVGSLPDRNVGEAISRMAGIALDRGDFGEGVTVSVRGNGPDLTRVELDGQAVQSAGGSNMAGGGDGRAVEFRQLSADLIKSVDVIKGSTADMVEGALGGSIQIKTRTGLDFKKPFASLRVAGSQSSLNKKWQPDANLILADKFMNGRLGLLLNASTTTLDNEGHLTQVAGNGNQGYYRLYDFDNSPQKTFTFQPNTVNRADAATGLPILQSPLAGGGYFNSATPLDLVSRSAAAQSKADCQAAFPALTATQLNSIASASRTAAQTQRTNELTTCLNQWNDYTPSGPRYVVKREIDRRQNLDLRADFKVNDDLTVYAKGSYNKRHDDINQLAFSMGNFTVKNGVANVQPGSVITDANHHVLQYTFDNTDSNGVAKTNQSHGIGLTTARYLQLGGTYKHEGWLAEFFAGDARSDFQKGIKELTLNDYYGSGTLKMLPNGLWGYSFPGFNPTDNSDLARFAQLYPRGASAAILPTAYTSNTAPAYTAAQQNAVTSSPNLTWVPTMYFSEERTAKADLTWTTPESIPFFKRFKTGYNMRDTRNDNWNINNGGYNMSNPVGTFGQPGFVAPLVMPSPTLRSSMYGCADTPGSLAPGGNACVYGWIPKLDIRQSLDGTTVLTMQQFADLMKQVMTLKATPTRFFSGASGRPDGLIDNWTQIDVEKLFGALNIPNTDFNCVKRCTASDGKVYDQPAQHLKERTDAFYLMTDFGLDQIPFTNRPLPFGWQLDGNIGVRYVRTRVSGTGMMSFTSITKTSSFDPNLPDAPGGTQTTTVQQATRTDAKTTDILPSFNLAAWVVPDQLVLRYSAAKTVARPPVSRLVASGSCTYNEVLAGQGDDPQKCSGTVGNPALQAQKNVNQNVSLEWYPNNDTMVTVAGFRQQGKVGPAIAQGVSRSPLFADSSLVDPVTGVSLAQMLFDYSTWMNGSTTGRKGVEFSTKTAFTFLPSLFRYTGFDANYTRMHSSTSTVNIVDLLTGVPLPPQNESKYTYNAALWYDDGRLSARVAVQAVGSYFNCIAACGQSTSMLNYPNAGGGRLGPPYNPGSPNFTDATRFIDAKVAYKWSPQVEIFVEGRNLGNATTSHSQQSFAPFADGTANLLDYAYAGRRIMVGVNFRTL